MANIGSVNLDIISNADGAQLRGGTTKRTLSWTGADITLNATQLIHGSNTFTLPSTTDTLVGRASTDTLTNKTLTAPAITGTTTVTSSDNTGIPFSVINNGTNSRDMSVQNTVQDATFEIRASAASKAAYINLFSTAADYNAISGYVSSSLVWRMGRSGTTTGINFYTLDGNTKAMMLDDSQNARFLGNVGISGKNSFAASRALYVIGGRAYFQQLTNPTAPTVTPTGGTGSTTYNYYIVANDNGGGKTVVSPVGTTTTGVLTLSGTTYNALSWTAVGGAVSYDILKTDTAHSVALAVTTTTYNDIGGASSAYTLTTRNTSADVSIDGYLQAQNLTDANNNPFLSATTTANAVDYLSITNAATANPATVAVGSAGSDTNVNLNLTSKGTGTVQVNGVLLDTISGTNTLTNKTLTTPKIMQINDTNGNPEIVNTATASAVNAIGITNAATGTAPVITIAGASSDANSDLSVKGKGTGKLLLGAQYQTPQTYTPSGGGTATLDLSTGNEHRITMPAGNITIAVSNAVNGQKFLVEITQDSVGSRTVTWFSTLKWAGGSTPTLTTTANKRDICGFIATSTTTFDAVLVAANI